MLVLCQSRVPVTKVANDNAPEHTSRPGFLHTFACAIDQGSKPGLSKNKSIIRYYNIYQVVQFNLLPLVVSFRARSKCQYTTNCQHRKGTCSIIWRIESSCGSFLIWQWFWCLPYLRYNGHNINPAIFRPQQYLYPCVQERAPFSTLH